MLTKVTPSIIKKAVRAAANPVTSTMGAGGKLIVMETGHGSMAVTKDGANVSRFLNYENKAIGLLASPVTDCANSTAKKAGDGTTLTALFVRELVEGYLSSLRKRNNIAVKRGAIKGFKKFMDLLETNRIEGDTEELRDLLVKTSLNNDDSKILKMVQSAVKSAGEFGEINVKRGDKNEVKVSNGYTLNNIRVAAQYQRFIPELGVEMQDVSVVIIGGTISSENDVDHLFTAYRKATGKRKTNRRPLLIIASGVQHAALATMVANQWSPEKPQNIKHFLYQVEMTSDELVELKTVIGVDEAIGESQGFLFKSLETNRKKVFGKVVNANMLRNKVTLTATSESQGDLDEMLFYAKKDYENSKSVSSKARVARLSGKSADVILNPLTGFGGVEIYDRVEDACLSGQSSYKGEFIIGGGAAIYEAGKRLQYPFWKSLFLNDEEFGENLVYKAAQSALKQICKNGGVDYSEIEKSVGFNKTYNVITDKFEHANKTTIIDSSFVVKTAMENAIETAMNMVNVAYVTAPKTNENE